MNRIAYMIVKNVLRVPIWFYHIWKYGKETDTHTEQERYDYLRYVVKNVNRAGKVTIDVSGAEHIPEENGFILFPNHQGLFDVLALIEACPNSFGVVVKKEASNVILVKQIIALLRGMSLDRQDVRSSMQVISKMTEEVKQGRNYIIFAEGTRSRNGNQILNFKAGTFKSAVNASCPIIPVALFDSFKPFDIKSIKKETVRVKFLEPLLPEQYKGMKTIQIAESVEESIRKSLEETKMQLL